MADVEENAEIAWRLAETWKEGGIWAVLSETVGHGATIEDLIDAGDFLVVRVRVQMTGEQAGLRAEMEFSQVLTFSKGELVLVEYFRDHQEALEAAGLSE